MPIKNYICFAENHGKKKMQKKERERKKADIFWYKSEILQANRGTKWLLVPETPLLGIYTEETLPIQNAYAHDSLQNCLQLQNIGTNLNANKQESG